ncbi:ATP-binding cassette subfamily B protein [Sinorhizobium terangae]|uniref:ATP-binding cassette domain-containing protein n=1 Tax=Sinorhizobium terangae TaxID=110322 RepID=A0A6N7LG35_SINTE|nr:ABC transporter ATP-binding protein [Sinorhizobium terangae]MBB4188978.1 ATP-binding cassette subfamily B protein [Sinorhizobium terangae]MQX16757.1 ATP-binding cassette domain-containing protein [Sinorhizobium terangae]
MIGNLYRLWPHPKLLIRLVALTAIQAVLQGLLLGCLVPILRALLQPRPDFAEAMPWLLAGAVGLALYWVLNVIATPLSFAASMELAAQLRHHLMSHVTTLPLGWFTGDRKARLARAITADCSHAATLTVTVGAPAITSTLVPATIFALTSFVDWRMALLFAAIAPLSFLALRRSSRVAAATEIELEAAVTEIAGRAIELGQAQPVLRAAGQSAGSVRMRAALDEHRATYRRGLGRSLVPDLTFTGVVMAGFVAVLCLGAKLLFDGEVPIAETVALLVLAVRFLEPLGTLIELVGALRAMDNAVARLQSILSTPPLLQAEDAARQIATAEIEFADVSFAYSDKPALREVSFRCLPGTMTALVGPSGSGKTTVIRLIARFFDVAEGAVRVGGIDVRAIDQATLMNDVAIIFQDVFLFDDTIEQNLRLAKPDATSEELAAAAKAARLDEVIHRLPEGWATRVGEGGAQLSGGERQRVSIARAFLKRARIVLIDEASSALDPENEAAISQAIAQLASDRRRTVVVIAHRPATLDRADLVIALRDGAVAEIGSPEQLRQSGGAFGALYRQYEQTRGWRIAATGPAKQLLNPLTSDGSQPRGHA